MILYKYKKDKGVSFLKNVKGKNSCFLCTIAHTETSSIPGISAAGASVDLIKYTPAADIEAIYFGKAKCLPAVPENPLGPPSPVIISIAALNLLKIPFYAINAGVKVKPLSPLIEINDKFGESIETGRALFHIDIDSVIEKTKILAKELAKSFQFVILGESVPGGTTTAMSLINGLGYNAFNKISGSMPGNQHQLKIELVKKSLNLITKKDSPINIVRKIGDPMQPVQAMLAIELVKQGVYVLLSGGTQMVAVAALIKSLINKSEKNIFYKIAIATTKWVTEDEHSDIVGLLENIDIDIPLFSANLDFSHSKYENLKLYEQGYVKEGVGAGGVSVALFNDLDIDNQRLLKHIENIYENIYLKNKK